MPDEINFQGFFILIVNLIKALFITHLRNPPHR
jgi:hypothetical protein